VEYLQFGKYGCWGEYLQENTGAGVKYLQGEKYRSGGQG